MKYKMIEIWIFAILTVLLLIFTLFRSQRHRFPRFFAFVSLSALVILNARTWFKNPFFLHQIFSWIFLFFSLLLAIHGFWMLRTLGSPDGDIEDTRNLVTSGAYKFIRHPLYSSLLFGGLGVLLKSPSLLEGALFLAVVVFIFVTAKVEEKENISRFGDQYIAYMKTSKMFVPFLI